jgi:hypothetical protein
VSSADPMRAQKEGAEEAGSAAHTMTRRATDVERAWGSAEEPTPECELHALASGWRYTNAAEAGPAVYMRTRPVGHGGRKKSSEMAARSETGGDWTACEGVRSH